MAFCCGAPSIPNASQSPNSNFTEIILIGISHSQISSKANPRLGRGFASSLIKPSIEDVFVQITVGAGEMRKEKESCSTPMWKHCMEHPTTPSKTT